MGLISNGTTLLDAGAINDGIATGNMILIKTLTASNSATLSFVHGASSVVLDGTYKSYVFKCINIHPIDDNVSFQINFRDGGTAYDATKTTTFFRAFHTEADATGFGYSTSVDLAQSTSAQYINWNLGNGNDESGCSTIQLFEPASTTFVKHFLARSTDYGQDNSIGDRYIAGYCNVTAAIDGVQFSFTGGNIDTGTIKMYGIL
jgi:hypothetical protein|tara:strand:+ start:347 stop:958 length:612 start_codon:yes stop_codon:yes gene_type:complete